MIMIEFRTIIYTTIQPLGLYIRAVRDQASITHTFVPQYPIMAIRVLLYSSQHGKYIDILPVADATGDGVCLDNQRTPAKKKSDRASATLTRTLKYCYSPESTVLSGPTLHFHYSD